MTAAAAGPGGSGPGDRRLGDRRLGDRSWTDLVDRRPLLLVPLGSVEQHGPHLPVATDAIIAEAVAGAAADALTDRDMLVAPTLSYGASGEHEGFPATVSLGQEALRLLLVEYARSACRWAGAVAFVNGHGGNVETLRGAVALLRAEGRLVAWAACAAAGADPHAGDAETSLLLHLRPELVRMADAAAGPSGDSGDDSGGSGDLATLLPRLRRDGVRMVSANGVLGDPTGADPRRGAALFAAMVDDLVAALRVGHTPGSPTPTGAPTGPTVPHGDPAAGIDVDDRGRLRVPNPAGARP